MSAREEARKIVAHYAEGPFILQDMIADLIARALSERDERLPDDMCPCGRSAYEAVGDPVQDHAPTCAVSLQAQLRERDTDLASYRSLGDAQWIRDQLAQLRERERVERNQDRMVYEASYDRDVWRRAYDEQKREAERLREAAQRLMDKMDTVHRDARYISVWTINQLHAGPYTGPKYNDEMVALHEALLTRRPAPEE